MAGEEGARKRLFISYGRKDAADFVARLRTDLGRWFDVWLDIDQIHPGWEWETAIVESGLRA